VYPVLVNILPPAPEQPVARYASEVLGLSSQREYRVLNLWTVEAEQVVTQPIAPLLPFVPVLRGGQAETVIRRAVELLRADAQLQGLERLLAFFASFVLSTALVEKLMRWDMTVIQDSPWYQEIIARGEQTGERRGRQEGRQEEAFRQLLRILQYRFPALPEALPARLQPLTVEQLESLVDAALAATSLDDFAAQIPH